MSKQEENNNIVDALNILNNDRNVSYEERRKYLLELHEDRSTYINGFYITQEIYSWIIWKPTSIEKQPEFKGEPLHKVVPKNVRREDCIKAVLNAQSWMYS